LQQAEKPSPTRSRAVSPIKAFLALAVVAIAAMAAIWNGNRDVIPALHPPSTPQSATAEQPVVTDREAAELFRKLNAEAVAAVQARDASRLDELFTATGPSGRRAERAIENLTKSGVRDRTQYEIEAVSVISKTSARIRVRVRTRIRGCYVDRNGKDVTVGPEEVVQSSVWTLIRDDERWLLHDAIIREQRPTVKRHATC